MFFVGVVKMENKAQAESVFRLMIDSIIGLAILFVIIASINYFQNQSIIQSKSDLYRLIEDASNSIDGKVISSKELTFSKGFGMDSFDAEKITGISQHCYSFKSIYGSIKISDDGKRVEFTQPLTTKVYSQCKPTEYGCDPRKRVESEANCCVKCIISFGKEIS